VCAGGKGRPHETALLYVPQGYVYMASRQADVGLLCPFSEISQKPHTSVTLLCVLAASSYAASCKEPRAGTLDQTQDVIPPADQSSLSGAAVRGDLITNSEWGNRIFEGDFRADYFHLGRRNWRVAEGTASGPVCQTTEKVPGSQPEGSWRRCTTGNRNCMSHHPKKAVPQTLQKRRV